MHGTLARVAVCSLLGFSLAPASGAGCARPPAAPAHVATPAAAQAAPANNATPTAAQAAPEQGLAAVLRATDIHGRPVGAAPHARATALVVFASWCGPCRRKLAVLGELTRDEPRLRVIGVSYAPYEEYGDRSSDEVLRGFVAEHAPWLQVVRADDALMDALGRPRKVPSLLLFDRRGQLVEAYLRARRQPPSRDELRGRIVEVISDAR